MIRRGFLEVEPSWVSWLLCARERLPSFAMSATGAAWQWRGSWLWPRAIGLSVPCVKKAIELTGDPEPRTVTWWANVLGAGAFCRPHHHDGKWAFIYHLTAGAPVHFGEPDAPESFAAEPGQILVFEAGTEHWTDAVTGEEPRVSIAGNLYYGRKR